MSIENMTSMSHFLLAAAVLAIVAAVVMFFALDISKCWKMVYGKAGVFKKQPGVNMRQKERLSDVTGAGYEADMKTVLLHDEEETLPLSHTGEEYAALPGKKDLELIQDIVYTQGES